MARCLRRRARLGSPGSRIGGRLSSRIACLCVLLTPDLKPVPVASHQAVSQDVQRTRPLLQNASLTRHLDRRLGDFFPGRRREHFHWFALTAFEGTVSNDFDVDRHRVAWGDLLFASPTGAWEAGTYELIVQGPGEAQAVLPIDLD